MQTPEQHSAHSQAVAQLSTLRTLRAAYELDWDRLEELTDAQDSAEDEYAALRPEDARYKWRAENPEDAEELADLQEAAGEWADQEDVQQAIDDNALSVEVRSGWCSLGANMQPEEFRIVLCTGGPHVQIRGELADDGGVHRAWLECSDWGTGLMEHFEDDAAELCAWFAGQFFTE